MIAFRYDWGIHLYKLNELYKNIRTKRKRIIAKITRQKLREIVRQKAREEIVISTEEANSDGTKINNELSPKGLVLTTTGRFLLTT